MDGLGRWFASARWRCPKFIVCLKREQTSIKTKSVAIDLIILLPLTKLGALVTTYECRCMIKARMHISLAMWCLDMCTLQLIGYKCRIAEYYLVLIVASMGCLYRSTNLKSK
jgi:hypothetical protein